MLGHGPIASTPIAGNPFQSGAAWGAFTLAGQRVTLRVGRKLPAVRGAFALGGQDIGFIVSFSQAAFIRVILVGSTSMQRYGYDMISDFNMVAGDSKTLVVTVKDSTGGPVNISGATISWKAARSLRKTPVISKAVNTGIIITNGPDGEFTVTLDSADTDDLSGNYYHEAQVTATDGTISTVLRGTMKVDRALIT